MSNDCYRRQVKRKTTGGKSKGRQQEASQKEDNSSSTNELLIEASQKYDKCKDYVVSKTPILECRFGKQSPAIVLISSVMLVYL